MDSSNSTAPSVTGIEGVVITRYLSGKSCFIHGILQFIGICSVAGLIVLLYDHCLTFEQERQLIWPTRVTVVKWALLCNRYIVEVILIVTAHGKHLLTDCRSPLKNHSS
jgi:Family of unknown function (DUF6533)